METPQNPQTPPNGETASNRIPWKLISVLVFITMMYTISLYFWTGKVQDAGMKQPSDDEVQTFDTTSSDTSEKQATSTDAEEVSTKTEITGKSDLKDKITGKYKKFSSFLLDESWKENLRNDAFSNIWGDENIFPISDTSVKVVYPKGSYKPSVSPRGGAGFIYNLGGNYEEIHLSYTVEFADNFDFVKGGKLPGLCGGSCPRGSEKGEGISVNLGWDKEKNLGISVIGSGGKTLLDESLSEVSAGGKYTISLGVKLGTPNMSDGSVEVEVNGKSILQQDHILLRGIKDFSVDSLFFSTFFGGSDASWATPVDTSVVFSNFKIYGTKK